MRKKTECDWDEVWPLPDLLKATDEAWQVLAIVDVLDVHHLEARFAIRPSDKVRIRQADGHRQPLGLKMRVEASLSIPRRYQLIWRRHIELPRGVTHADSLSLCMLGMLLLHSFAFIRCNAA